MTVAEPGFDELFAVRPQTLRHPAPVYARARAERPVLWSDRLEAYVITRYDDIMEVLQAPESFSSKAASGPASVTPLAAQLVADPATPPRLRAQAERRLQISAAKVLLNSDPPLHVRQRKLINKAFTARRVNSMEADVREIANRLIDAFAADGKVELVSQFSIGLPMTVIAGLLGVPASMHGTFKRWSSAFTAGTGNLRLGSGEVAAMFDSVDEFYDYFTEQIADRQAHPRDDLLTGVVAARIDGEEPLSLEEMLQMLVQFLVAGNETTTNLLTSITYRLVTDVELMAKVRADGSLIRLLVEEVLRVESPVQGLFRQANEDTTIGGVDIPAGSVLWLVYASGNRDDAYFPSGDQVVLDGADTRKHLAFGRGEHSCLGNLLARLEARAGIDTLLSRLDDLRLVGSPEDIPWLPNFVLHGICELHLTFRAA
jgi:cytochrome P450